MVQSIPIYYIKWALLILNLTPLYIRNLRVLLSVLKKDNFIPELLQIQGNDIYQEEF